MYVYVSELQPCLGNTESGYQRPWIQQNVGRHRQNITGLPGITLVNKHSWKAN
jgi:hypothetical protein